MYWTIDTHTFAASNWSYGWLNGWCGEAELSECSGAWQYYGSSMPTEFSATCGAFEVEELDCVEDSAYAASVCVSSSRSHNEGLWSGPAQFEVSLDYVF